VDVGAGSVVHGAEPGLVGAGGWEVDDLSVDEVDDVLSGGVPDGEDVCVGVG
jgi:hypothetical protein